jgi:hypothetical protein
MSETPILPRELQVASLAVLGLFLAWVLRLIRTHRLTLRDSLVWLVSTGSAIVVTAFPTLLVRAASLVGVQVPANALFGVALLYLALNVLVVTLGVSSSSERVRRLTQECALLRADLDALRARLPSAPSPAPAAPPSRAPDAR